MSIDEIKKLLAAKTSNLAKLDAAAAAIPAMRKTAIAARDSQEAKRRDCLLNGSDEALAALDAEHAAAARQIERLDVLAEEVESRLTEARDNALVAEVNARRKEAMLLRDAAAEKVKAYPELAKPLLDLLRDIAAADAAVADFNRLAMSSGVDVDLLTGPEDAARERPLLARNLLSSEIVEKWVYADHGGDVLGFDVNAKITFDKVERKWVYLPTPNGFASEVVKCKFRKDTFLAAHSFGRVEPLASSLSLPGLTVGDRPLWAPIEHATPDEIISALEALASPSPSPHVERRTDIVWTPINDEAAADRAA